MMVLIKANNAMVHLLVIIEVFIKGGFIFFQLYCFRKVYLVIKLVQLLYAFPSDRVSSPCLCPDSSHDLGQFVQKVKPLVCHMGG